MAARSRADHAGKVVITDAGQMLDAAVQTLATARADVEVLPDGLGVDAVVDRCAGAEVLIDAYVPLSRNSLKRLGSVGLIIRCGVGVELIDVEAATQMGIWVANIPDYGVDEVADHAMLLLLAAARHLNHYQRSWVESGWGSYQHRPTHRLKGRRLGIIGLGRTGSRLAARAKAFGMEIVAYTPRLTPARARDHGANAVSLDELLSTSDVISLNAPLTPDTRCLLDRAAFARMRRGVIILNTARGGLIDTRALQEAIDDGTVAGAALDVLEGEPTPDLSLPMFRSPEVTVTPHVAWYSDDAVRDLGVLAAEEALRFLRGERPRAVLNPDARSVRSRPTIRRERGGEQIG